MGIGLKMSAYWLTSWASFDPLDDKTNKMTIVSSEDIGQPDWVFTVHSMGGRYKASSCGQRRLISDWVYDQADLCVFAGHNGHL